MRAARLGDLVLVVREDQIEPAAVDVEYVAQQLARHRRALDVPAGAAGRPDAGGRWPRRFARHRRLPQYEVVDVALVGFDLHPRARFHLAKRSPRKPAIIRHRGHVEQHMVIGDVSVAAFQQRLAQRYHFRDEVGRARFGCGRQHAKRCDVLVELRRGLRRQFANRLDWWQRRIPLCRPLVDLVIDVGDVARIGDVLGAVDLPQQPEQHVEHDDRPCVADMGKIVNGRPAHVHAHIGPIDGLQPLLAARQRVVECQISVGHDERPLEQGLARSDQTRLRWKQRSGASRKIRR